MKYGILILVLFIQIVSFGCSPVRRIGDPIGSTVGEITDELGGEKTIGKGNDTITIHPEADKKIKMEF